MIMFLKLVGLIGAFLTVSDATGITEFHSQAPQSGITVSSEATNNAAYTDTTSRQPALPETTLFQDIVTERDFFTRYDFGENNRDTLCGINRKIQSGENTLGLLLLEPSGMMKTLIIDRGTLTVSHQQISLLRKELREELSRHGVLASDAKLIARKITELEKQAVKK